MNCIFSQKRTFLYSFRLFLVFIIYASSSLFCAEKKDGEHSSKGDVKRRVLILDFVKLQKKESFDFLETSIPDAIEGPLNDTKSFMILPRSIWGDYVKSGKFKKPDAKNEKKALEAAKMAKADVVIIGQFVIIGTKMTIIAKALDVESGRIVVSKSKMSNTDASMFTAIENISLDLAVEMKKKLPPLKQKIVRGFILEVSAAPMVAMNFGYSQENFPKGIGAALNFNLRNSIIRHDYIGISAGYANFNSVTKKFNSMALVHVGGRIGYEIHLMRWWSLIPYGSSGLDFESIDSVTFGSEDYRMVYFGGGIENRFYFTKSFFTSININAHMQSDAELVPFVLASLGIGYVY